MGLVVVRIAALVARRHWATDPGSDDLRAAMAVPRLALK
jgi:hypothetical protein